jgi:DNA-binding NarL/FixJ family response regulator
MSQATADRPIRVLSVDDHLLLREGVAAILANQADITLAGEAENGTEAVAKHRAIRPDVTLMDLQMPGIGGIEAIEAIRQESPQARIIVLTTYEGDVRAVRALKAGAAAFLLKSSLRHELLDTIRSVHAGHRHVPAEIAQEIALHAADDPLSLREISILELVAGGNANKEIAWRLKISEETVKAHMKSIFSKLSVSDRTHAVTEAIKRGIIRL